MSALHQDKADTAAVVVTQSVAQRDRENCQCISKRVRAWKRGLTYLGLTVVQRCSRARDRIVVVKAASNTSKRDEVH